MKFLWVIISLFLICNQASSSSSFSQNINTAKVGVKTLILKINFLEGIKDFQAELEKEKEKLKTPDDRGEFLTRITRGLTEELIFGKTEDDSSFYVPIEEDVRVFLNIRLGGFCWAVYRYVATNRTNNFFANIRNSQYSLTFADIGMMCSNFLKEQKEDISNLLDLTKNFI
jgi:hypothetical protein